jgi:hypothetical protein
MRARIAGLAVAIVFALVAGSAAADSGVLTLAAGQETVVASMALNAGDVVDWSYTSAGFTKFTIEQAGTEVFSTTSLIGTGKFTVPTNGQYTFGFRNTGDTPALVSYDVKRPFSWLPIIALVGVGLGAVAGISGFVWMRKKRAARLQAGLAANVPPPPPPPYA